jgi:hypothetical protein
MTAILEPQTAPVHETVPVLPELDRAPAPAPVAPEPPAPPRVPRVRQALSRRGVRIYAVAMIALYAVGTGVQPTPDGPQPVAPWWADVLNTVVFVGMLTVLAGAFTGRRWTLWTGLASGASLFALSASCPLEGHHEIAAWWFVQMAVGVAMTALAATLLRRTQKA